MSDVACPLSDVAMVPDRIYSNVITVSAIVIAHPISSCADSGGARNFVDNLREVSSPRSSRSPFCTDFVAGK